MDMAFIPHVVAAEYVGGYKVMLRFNDGMLRLVGLKSYAVRGGVFQRLKDIDYFQKFFIDLNTICWPNGADIAPERLYELGEIVHRENMGGNLEQPRGHQPQV
jgi:hypothetical protein